MDFIRNRLKLCEENIEETFKQIKMLQSKHQQLIGYQQALKDIINDLESESINLSVESIAPRNET